jgi:hypothetical protein
MPRAPFYFSQLSVSEDGRVYRCVNVADAG